MALHYPFFLEEMESNNFASCVNVLNLVLISM
jgi:hypothetical protein